MQKMKADGRIAKGSIGMTCATDKSEINNIEQITIWDNMSGKQLETKLVNSARAEEMEEVRKHSVYKKVPISQCLQETGQEPIGTRWVDVNKGDDLNIDYRSRLVAQELKRLSWADDLFAATPLWK